jgi:hypothetical protein
MVTLRSTQVTGATTGALGGGESLLSDISSAITSSSSRIINETPDNVAAGVTKMTGAVAYAQQNQKENDPINAVTPGTGKSSSVQIT